MRADNVSFALTVILNILCPPARNPQQQQNSSSKSTIHHLSFSENHRCSSFSQSDKIHRPENQLLLNVAYLGSQVPCLYIMLKAGVILWCQFILQLLLLNVAYIVQCISSFLSNSPCQETNINQEFYCDVSLHLYIAAVVEYYLIRRLSSSMSRVESRFFLHCFVCPDICLAMYMNTCDYIYDSCLYIVPKF